MLLKNGYNSRGSFFIVWYYMEVEFIRIGKTDFVFFAAQAGYITVPPENHVVGNGDGVV